MNERDMTSRSFIIPDDGLTGFDSVIGFLPSGDKMQSERVYAFELGVRSEVSDDVTVDFAAFYNDFSNLRTDEAVAPIVLSPTETFFGSIAKNNGSGIVRGAEVAVQVDVSEDTELEVQYTYINMDLQKKAKSGDFFFLTLDDDPPHSILNIIAHHDIDDEWSVDGFLLYVDDIPTPDLNLDSYWRGDVRVSWRPDSQSEYAFGLQNLFHDGEVETGANAMEAAAYVKATKNY
jgi:iron complex outermembrane receptor protein